MAEAQAFKNHKGKAIRSGQKLMAYNVYLKNAESMSKTAAVKLTATELGIGQNTVWSLIKEIEGSGTARSPKKSRKCSTKYDKLQEFEKSAIRRHVHAFYFRNELPTVLKLLNVINDDDSLPNFSHSSLYRILLKLGFKYDKRSRKSMLIEKPEIVLWRRKYLTSIKQYREEGRTIYYTDETWVNAGHVKTKVWQDKTITTARQALLQGLSTGIRDPSGKGKRLIVVHIGSDAGFVDGGLLNFESKKTGDYHEDMNGEVFKQWLESILPNLEENSVIVMDNAPYHSVKSEKVPTQSWRKNDIVNWLNYKGIETRGDLLKLELLELVKRHRISHPDTYVIDEMVKNSGRTILRLPPYHCNLNPIELVWAQVKHHVAANNTTYKICDVKRLLNDGIATVTAEHWRTCVQHALDEEQRMWNLDGIVEDIVEKIIINVGSDSSSDDSVDEDMEINTLST